MIRFLKASLFMVLAGFLMLSGSSLLMAEELMAEESVLMRVRVIDASGAEGEEEIMPSELKDIEKRLGYLPFSRYAISLTKTLSLKAGEEKVLELADGQSLTVDLIRALEHKNVLHLKWDREAGKAILDAQAKIREGEVFMTGTDCPQGMATILAIDFTD